MTEPEQWAVELLSQALAAPLGSPKAAALTIQRAFEERERELREAFTHIQNEGDARSNVIATRALATRQPTPTEGSSDEEQ